MRWLLILLLALPGVAANYDWLIRDARIVDGTGNPWYIGDVGVSEGRIAAIGDLSADTATHVIDAQRRVLAPGFIDVHTHVESTLKRVPLADNFIHDGVTTIVTGNCGTSEVDLGSWFDSLESAGGIGINMATLVGHNSIREQVMGTANRHATPEEMEQMKALVAKAMEAGAVGFSTGLIYVPGTYAPTEEVLELARVAARYHGVYASHMRDEGEKVMEAIEEALQVGRATGMRVELSHFKIDNKNLWGSSDRSLALVEQARDEGLDVVVDQYPYDRSSTSLNMLLPSWALAGGTDAFRKVIQDPEQRQRVIADMKDYLHLKGHDDYSWAMVAWFEPDHSIEGKTISEINLERGREASLDNEIQTILELAERSYVQMVYHSMSMEDVDRIMQYPNTAIGSDGGTRVFGLGMPHPRSYGTNARVLAEFVRERSVLRLEDAIRRMTSLPARTFDFKDRGLLRAGFAADMVLFDPARVQDNATYSSPHHYSTGFDLVLVNGKAVLENGELTGERAGRILRHSWQ